MSPRPLDLLIINSSVREGRFGPVVDQWFAGRARLSERFETTELDLVEFELPAHLPAERAAFDTAEGRTPVMRDLYERLDRAEAFVIVTPEYNHGYPASLKSLIDWHYAPWA